MSRIVGQLRMVGAGLLIVAVGLATLMPPVAASAPQWPDEAGNGQSWLAAELDTHNYQLPGPTGDESDWGLTADAALALASSPAHVESGRRTEEQIRANVAAYVSWDEQGMEGVRLAGPLAKVALTGLVYGEDPSDYGGWDVEAELRGLMETDGEMVGRFADENPHSDDTANMVGQALAVTALSRTSDGVPTEAVDFLLDQQCTDGGFRTFHYDTRSCEPDHLSDPDVTAFAVQALLAVSETGQVQSAIDTAAEFFREVQDPETGGFGGSGPTEDPNSNSSGLGAQALRAMDVTGVADEAAAYVASLQLTSDNAGEASADIGAIAYNEAAFEDGVADGIPDARRDQWRRASAQAVLAFDAPGLNELTAAEPLEGGVHRLSGEHRVATAVAVSQEAYGEGEAAGVVLATAGEFADALAGTPLAAAVDGPLLLTWPTELADEPAAEISRVLPDGGTVHVLGGHAALAPEVDEALTDAGYDVERIAGADRVETAISIASAMGDPGALLITTGFDFPDALAAGTAAAHDDGGVLLTAGDDPHPAVADYLASQPEADVYAVGGPAVRAFPDAIAVSGPTRDATAVAVAEVFFDAADVAGVARHDDFADALAGGAHVGSAGGPLLLTPTDDLSADTSEWLCGYSDDVNDLWVYGGEAAVTSSVVNELEAHLQGQGCG